MDLLQPLQVLDYHILDVMGWCSVYSRLDNTRYIELSYIKLQPLHRPKRIHLCGTAYILCNSVQYHRPTIALPTNACPTPS